MTQTKTNNSSKVSFAERVYGVFKDKQAELGTEYSVVESLAKIVTKRGYSHEKRLTQAKEFLNYNDTQNSPLTSNQRDYVRRIFDEQYKQVEKLRKSNENRLNRKSSEEEFSPRLPLAYQVESSTPITPSTKDQSKYQRRLASSSNSLSEISALMEKYRPNNDKTSNGGTSNGGDSSKLSGIESMINSGKAIVLSGANFKEIKDSKGIPPQGSSGFYKKRLDQNSSRAVLDARYSRLESRFGETQRQISDLQEQLTEANQSLEERDGHKHKSPSKKSLWDKIGRPLVLASALGLLALSMYSANIQSGCSNGRTSPSTSTDSKDTTKPTTKLSETRPSTQVSPSYSPTTKPTTKLSETRNYTQVSLTTLPTTKPTTKPITPQVSQTNHRRTSRFLEIILNGAVAVKDKFISSMPRTQVYDEQLAVNNLVTSTGFENLTFPLATATFDSSNHFSINTVEYQGDLSFVNKEPNVALIAKAVSSIYNPKSLDLNAFDSLTSAAKTDSTLVKHLNDKAGKETMNRFAQFLGAEQAARHRKSDKVPKTLVVDKDINGNPIIIGPKSDLTKFLTESQ